MASPKFVSSINYIDNRYSNITGMNVIQTTKIFLNLFILRAKPSDVPYSKTFLLFLSIVFLLTKSGVYLWFIQIMNRFDIHEVANLSYMASMLIAVIWILLLFAILHSVLAYYKMLGRFVQLATAFVGMECLLTFLFLVWLTSLSFIHAPLTLNAGTIGIVL